MKRRPGGRSKSVTVPSAMMSASPNYEIASARLSNRGSSSARAAVITGMLLLAWVAGGRCVAIGFSHITGLGMFAPQRDSFSVRAGSGSSYWNPSPQVMAGLI